MESKIFIKSFHVYCDKFMQSMDIYIYIYIQIERESPHPTSPWLLLWSPPFGSGSWAASCIHVRFNKSNHFPPSSSPTLKTFALSLSLSSTHKLTSHVTFIPNLSCHILSHFISKRPHVPPPLYQKILLIIWNSLDEI